MTKSASSRLGRHHITDPFLRFYYRFLSRRQSQLALGAADQALEEIKKHLVDFIGTHTWEELCREWLIRASGKKILPFLSDQIGSIWNRDAQVDVVGINTMDKTLVLGECKWDRHLTDVDVLQKLIEKTDKVVPSAGQWKVYYLGFSRKGWAAGAQKFAKSMKTEKISGINWQSTGMLLRIFDQAFTRMSAFPLRLRKFYSAFKVQKCVFVVRDHDVSVPPCFKKCATYPWPIHKSAKIRVFRG